MTVLVLTRSDDQSAASVIDCIRAEGERAFRLDTDRVPTEVRVSAEYNRSTRRARIASPDDQLDLNEVSAVWHRRLRVGGQLPKSMNKQLRSASQLESRATLLGMIASLKCFCLDPLANIRHAQNKQLQLQLAEDLGLTIPRTLITNEPSAVREFHRRCEGNIVAKMLSSFAIYEDGEERVVFTNAVASEDLEGLESLQFCR
jgi:hypothetical protein